MKVNWKVVSVALAAVLIYDSLTIDRARARGDRMYEDLKDVLMLSNLHTNLLIKNEIRYDPFEAIVVHDLYQRLMAKKDRV